MYNVGAQGVDERMINVHYYNYNYMCQMWMLCMYHMWILFMCVRYGSYWCVSDMDIIHVCRMWIVFMCIRC